MMSNYTVTIFLRYSFKCRVTKASTLEYIMLCLEFKGMDPVKKQIVKRNNFTKEFI